MHKGRMEAFTDGVIAVIITIMVLELKLPRAATWDALAADLPVFLSYVLSFAYVGIYWKTIVSPIGYVLGIASAFFAPILSCVIYAVVAVLWFVPDRRFERVAVR